MKEQVAAANPPQTPTTRTYNRPPPPGYAQTSHPALPVQRQLNFGPSAFTPVHTPIDQNRPGARHYAPSPAAAVADQGSAQETSRTGKVQSQLKEGIEAILAKLAETQQRISDDALTAQRQTDERLADYFNPIFNGLTTLETNVQDIQEKQKQIIAKQQEHSIHLSDLNRLMAIECAEIVQLQQFTGLRPADPQQDLGQQETIHVAGDDHGTEEHGEGTSDVSSDA